MAQHLSFYRKIWVRLIHDKCFQILQTQLLFDACCRTICYLPCFRHDWLCFVFFMVIFVLYSIMLYIVSWLRHVTSLFIMLISAGIGCYWILYESLWILLPFSGALEKGQWAGWWLQAVEFHWRNTGWGPWSMHVTTCHFIDTVQNIVNKGQVLCC